MAEGMAAMAEEAMDEAIGHFDFVLSLAELDDRFLLSIVYFWKGRCLRRRGEYDEALTCTVKGKDLALALGHPRMAAVMQVLEGWLLFQQGKWEEEAVRISQAAERALADTDDHVTLGNIQSFYGRMARREGRFDKAVEFFEGAIRHYGQRDARHLNLARSLANMALAKRGIALQLQKTIDRDVQRRRKTSGNREAKAEAGSFAQGSRKRDYRSRLSQLRREALEHLEAARSIYQQRPNHHGSGTVHLNAAYIHLDGGDFQRAEDEAVLAFELAEEKQDYILMDGRAFWSA